MIKMAITLSQGFNPIWYIADFNGKPLAGGYLAPFSSLNPEVVKPIYEDVGGNYPWPQVPIPHTQNLTGILFDASGSQGPFFFKFDSTIPGDLYDLEVYDADGNLRWTVDGYSGSGTGGGGGGTTVLNPRNLVINNVFWRNSPSPSPAGLFWDLAPGANTGLAQTGSNAGPDICFVSDTAGATDNVSFPSFSLGSSQLTPDVTPEVYLKYACTVVGTESKKYVQYPITKGVQNLSNQPVVITFWARGNSGNTALTLSWLQFFGDAAPASASAVTIIGTVTTTTSWVQYTITTAVPNATGSPTPNQLGVCGNDGLFLQVNYPLNALSDIDHVKLCAYLGTVAPTTEYQNYDVIDGAINTPRTGDIRTSINTFSPFGWVGMNDTTIGSALSNANGRASVDTFPLFSFLWNINAAYTPMFTSTGVPVARGGSAVGDFASNYKIQLTASLGRVMAGAGASTGTTTAHSLGQFLGEETHNLSRAELPQVLTTTTPSSTAQAGVGVAVVIPAAGFGGATLRNQEGGNSFNQLQPTVYMNVFIKL